VEAEARYLRAVLRRSRGELEAAISDVRAVRRLGAPLTIAGDARLLEGELLYELGRYEAAAAAFERFTRTAPDDARVDYARWYRAEALAQTGRCDLAVPVYQELLQRAESQETRQRARFGRGWCHRREGDESAALADFAAASLGPAESVGARARFEAGASAYRLGAYADALAWLEGRHGVPVEGDPTRRTLMIGQTLYELGRKADAEPHLEASLALPVDAERAKILYQLGWIALETERPSDAAGRFEEILSDPSVSDSLRVAADYGLGISRIRADDLAGAAAPLERVRAVPGAAWGAEARYALAFVYHRLGDYARSQAAIDELASLHPDSPLLDEANLVAGENLYHAQRYEDAARLYRQQLDRGEGDSGDVLFRLAITQFKLGRYPEASRALGDLVLRYPGSPHRQDARFWLAESHYRMGHYEDARREYEALRLASEPGSEHALDAQYGLAWCDYSEGSYAEAASRFGMLLDAYRGTSREDDILLRRGNCFYNLRRFEEAVEDYDRLLSRYSQSRYAERALYQKAWSLHRLDRFDEARAAFESLESRYPESELVPQALYWAGYALFRDEQYATAAERFSRVALSASAPDSLRTQARIRMAESYFNARDFTRAASLYEALTSPAYPTELRESAYDGWIRSLEADGRTPEAESVVTKMAQRMPENASSGEALYRIGVRYLESGKLNEGIGALRKYLEGGTPPDYLVDANRRCAEASLQLGEKLRAAEYYRNAAHHGDRDDGIEFRFEAGRLFYELGKYTLARDEFRRVVRLDPKPDTALLARYNLGLALKETGETEEALEAFDAVGRSDRAKPDLEADALLEAGLLLRKDGAHERSQGYLCDAAAIGKGATGAEAQYWCSEVDFDAERFAAAIGGYRRILEVFEGEREWGLTARYRLAECFERLNHWARAREQYEAILAASDDDTWTSDARERLDWMQENSWVFEETPIGDPSEWETAGG
jgi:TolA-binding protein